MLVGVSESTVIGAAVVAGLVIVSAAVVALWGRHLEHRLNDELALTHDADEIIYVKAGPVAAPWPDPEVNEFAGTFAQTSPWDWADGKHDPALPNYGVPEHYTHDLATDDVDLWGTYAAEPGDVPLAVSHLADGSVKIATHTDDAPPAWHSRTDVFLTSALGYVVIAIILLVQGTWTGWLVGVGCGAMAAYRIHLAHQDYWFGHWWKAHAGLEAFWRQRAIAAEHEAHALRAELVTAETAVEHLTAIVQHDPLGGDPRHLVNLTKNDWTLQHPLSCRPNLFACPVNEGLAEAVETLCSNPTMPIPGLYQAIDHGSYVSLVPATETVDA